MSIWLYYCLAVLLSVGNVIGFLANFASLPGNWLIVAATGAFAFFVHSGQHSVSWAIVGLLLFLAIVGELLEFLAGTAGAAKQGASRRSLVLSVVVSIIGSILGAMVGMPIPILGSAFAALLGGALGAGVGAAIGEDWNGRDMEGSIQVGAAAFAGRMLGTAGKLIVGGIMLVIATIDLIW